MEFTVEPFRDGAPGPHVQAAIDALTACGFAVDIGPFGSAVEGDAAALSTALSGAVLGALTAGATRISIQVTRL